MNSSLRLAATPESDPVERLDSNMVILAVRGIVDMAVAPILADQIRAILRRRPPTVVIDVSEVSFLATAGMSVLMAGAAQFSARQPSISPTLRA